jgi:hypothetical protein
LLYLFASRARSYFYYLKLIIKTAGAAVFCFFFGFSYASLSALGIRLICVVNNNTNKSPALKKNNLLLAVIFFLTVLIFIKKNNNKNGSGHKVKSTPLGRIKQQAPKQGARSRF